MIWIVVAKKRDRRLSVGLVTCICVGRWFLYKRKKERLDWIGEGSILTDIGW